MSAVASPGALLGHPALARRGALAVGARRERCRPHRPPVLAAAVFGVVLIAGVGGGRPPATSPAPVQVARASHVVQPGDTLWSIARSLQPTGDVRPLVDRLATARRGAPLRVGERVDLPR